MANPNSPVQAIAEKLKEYKVIPSELNVTDIEDEYSLMEVIRANTKKSQVKFYNEDIGTDNDADEDYVAIMQRFSKASAGAIIYDNIKSSTTDDNVKIEFKCNNKAYSWSFQQESDSLSEEFLDLVIAHSKECALGEFINLIDENSIMLGFIPKEIANLLYQNEIIY